MHFIMSRYNGSHYRSLSRWILSQFKFVFAVTENEEYIMKWYEVIIKFIITKIAENVAHSAEHMLLLF